MLTKSKRKTSPKTDSEKLDEIIRLLQILIASNLYDLGIKQQEIGKQLGIATASVNQMLKGVNKES